MGEVDRLPNERVPDPTVEALRQVVAEHRPNSVTEGVPGNYRTRVKCDGETCNFYVERPRYWDAMGEHDDHLVAILAARAAAPDATHAPLDGGRRCTCGWPWDSMPRKAGDQAIHAAAAAPDALRVRIEALAAEWERDADERPAMPRRHIAQLRALLEDGAQ